MYLLNYISNSFLFKTKHIDIVNDYCYLRYNIDFRIAFTFNLKKIAKRIDSYNFNLICSFRYLEIDSLFIIYNPFVLSQIIYNKYILFTVSTAKITNIKNK